MANFLPPANGAALSNFLLLKIYFQLKMSFFEAKWQNPADKKGTWVFPSVKFATLSYSMQLKQS